MKYWGSLTAPPYISVQIKTSNFNCSIYACNTVKSGASAFIDKAELFLALENLSDDLLAIKDFPVRSAGCDILEAAVFNPTVAAISTKKIRILTQFHVFKATMADFAVFKAENHFTVAHQLFEL